MYTPAHFAVRDKQELARFLADNAFGVMISQMETGLEATHLPFLLEDDGRILLAHLAKANPHWQQLDGKDVLVVFSGEHGYVSPNWYEGSGVPTWNYQALHVRARVSVFSDHQRLHELVERLSSVYEAQLPEPWQANYDERMLAGIMGLELSIVSMQGKYKLSQNHSATDRREVARQLALLGNEALSRAVLDTLEDGS